MQQWIQIFNVVLLFSKLFNQSKQKRGKLKSPYSARAGFVLQLNVSGSNQAIGDIWPNYKKNN